MQSHWNWLPVDLQEQIAGMSWRQVYTENVLSEFAVMAEFLGVHGVFPLAHGRPHGNAVFMVLHPSVMAEGTGVVVQEEYAGILGEYFPTNSLRNALVLQKIVRTRSLESRFYWVR